MEVSLSDITLSPYAPVVGADVMPGEYVQLSLKDTGVGMRTGGHATHIRTFFTTREVGKRYRQGLAVVYGS